MTLTPDLMMLCPPRPVAMARLRASYRVHRWDLAPDKEGFMAEHGPKCRAVATSGHIPVTRRMLEAMPDLGIVACSSAGFEAFDIAALAGRNIALTNTSAALCGDVADAAIMLMLAARRSLVSADAYVRSGGWGRNGMFPLLRTIGGRSLGIVGMGAIGQAIASRAAGFGMKIGYWNRRPRDVPWSYHPDLTALARDSDNLVIAVAGGPETRGLISARVIEALGPDGLLVNVARGSVIDEPALIAALSDGRLGAAALDVYAHEPDPDPRLAALSNVTLFPHHASGTVETRDAMAQLMVDNLDAYFAGRPLVTPVDLSRYL